MNKYAVVFLTWGDQYIKEVYSCITKSEKYLAGYDKVLITDGDTQIDDNDGQFTHVIRAEFKQQGLLRKTELHEYLPDTYAGYLLLDSDTVIVEDISLGFKKAEIHGIAASPAPHYSLDHFWGFDLVMKKEGVSTIGQLQYNTGVIFFKNSPAVKEVFKKWGLLGCSYQDEFTNDQPFFTLAMEQLEFNPYTLSISYNYRGFGEFISGDVRIWHSHGSMPEKINEYDSAWPPRRAWPGRVEHAEQGGSGKLRGILGKFVRCLRRFTRRKPV
jgi:hypothetical protein